MKIVIAIPAYNEALILANNSQILLDFCQKNIAPDEFVIVIANNNSSDQTGRIADQLAHKHTAIKHLFLAQQGKGLAIAAVWQKYEADIYVFMDADLSTDLSALPQLISGLKNGADAVIGSRRHSQSQIKRSLLRRFISLSYSRFFKVLFKTKISDLPCGFKAVNRQIRDEVLPQVKNTGFFWDTEFLILAEKKGFIIEEIPIAWSEFTSFGRKSRVNILKTSWEYIKQSFLLKKRLGN